MCLLLFTTVSYNLTEFQMSSKIEILFPELLQRSLSDGVRGRQAVSAELANCLKGMMHLVTEASGMAWMTWMQLPTLKTATSFSQNFHPT